eukprot:6179143-Pleurochrysis_carterae.AAC.1
MSPAGYERWIWMACHVFGGENEGKKNSRVQIFLSRRRPAILKIVSQFARSRTPQNNYALKEGGVRRR